MWEAEYNKFIPKLSTFGNKDINDFWRSVVVMGDSVRKLCISNTHYYESTQATSQWMDRVQKQETSIRSDLKEQINRVVQEVKTELRTEFRGALDKKIVLLEMYVEMRVNEVHQSTTSTLEQLKETVVAVRGSQERMWRAIDRMSTEVQELFQTDDGTKSQEETEPLLAIENPAKEEPVIAEASTIAQPIPQKIVLA